MYCSDAHGQWIIKGKIKLDKKIILIDLDGTFVSINTFHKWMKFLFIEALKKLQLTAVMKIFNIILLRYTKRITHKKMKYMILEISEQIITQKQITDFVHTLAPYVNQELFNITQDNSKTTILATAAPLFYAKSIKELYQFDFVLATDDITHIPWQENIREEKAKNIKKLFDSNKWDFKNTILYTDHYDDMPLMKIVSLTYLLNASEKTKTLTHNANINFEVISEQS